jgi:TPR repeat protein
MKKGTIACALIGISTLLLIILTGCSHTPGDAAVHGGHSQAGADLYLEGAELGHADAALKLGLLLEEGRVSDPRYRTAGHWFKRACELGSTVGCHNTGVAYEYGKDGMAMDYVEASNYYRRAAEKGYMQSQYNLGSMYSNNYLTPPDNVEGYMWMLLAEKAARACSKEPICHWILKDQPGHRMNLKNRLSETQVEQAEALAASWKASQ